MANRIHRLPPGLAEKIAAGEVIERPASVVKELLENSLDAGATEVQVTLEEGGKNLIEVLDNGHGMGPEDLSLCIERHATSKLHTLEDLEKINTLGFRGEALPSVAAVSELSIVSRSSGEEQAYELRAGDFENYSEARGTVKKITFGHFNHSPHGTRIRAAALFSTIPARLKFLKSTAAEVSAVREWMERLALAYPQVGFRLLSNERTVLDLRPQTEADRARQILSDGEDFPLFTADSEQDGFRDLGLQIRIHWLQGMSAGSGRKLIQVVNHRAIRDRLLQQALLTPFRQILLPGQYPVVAILMSVNPAAIDVNVHPTKSEIRFLDSRKIFSTVNQLVRKLILEKGAPAIPQWKPSGFEASAKGDSAPPLPAFPTSVFDATESQAPSLSHSNPSASPLGSTTALGFAEKWQPRQTSGARPARFDWNAAAQQLRAAEQNGTVPEQAQENLTSEISQNDLRPYPEQTSPPTPSATPDLPIRFAGSFFQTYFFIEQGEELLLVDQHAAHERVRYEALRKKVLGSGEEIPELASQTLLVPEMVRFARTSALDSEEARSVLNAQLPKLTRLGFDLEFFGEDTLIFRGVPAEWGNHDLKTRLKNLVNRVLEAETQMAGNASPTLMPAGVPAALPSPLMDEALFEALASQACHSSVRAGDPLEKEEMLHLFQELFRCEHPWNCPHGRPTVVKLSRTRVEEWFQRRVTPHV